MVAGVCIECGHPVGSAKRPCAQCGCAEPMPTKARHRCVSCGNGVMSVKQACSHCGAPDPLSPGPIVPALVRCSQCGNPTHVSASHCRKCRTPSGSFVPNAEPPVSSAPAEPSRPASPGRQPSTERAARSVSGGAPPTLLAAPLWDPSRARPASPAPASPQPVPVAEPAPDESAPVDAPPTAVLANRVPCGRCAELQPRGTRTCARCGVADPENAEPLAHRKPLFGFVQLPTLPVAVALVGLLGLGGLTAYTRIVKEEQRKQRVWAAFGSRATEQTVANVEQQAASIGVSTDVLLRIRFYCLHREAQRPSDAWLKQARVSAERDGRDPERAVSEVARSACGREAP